MINITKYFNKSQLELLNKNAIHLKDDKDYTDDELIEIFDSITEKYLDQGFKNDKPTDMARPWEEIVDGFPD